MFASQCLVSASCTEPWAEGQLQGDKGTQGEGARCCVWSRGNISHTLVPLSAWTPISIWAIFPTLKEFPKGHCSKIRRSHCCQREGPPLTGCHTQVEGVDAVGYRQMQPPCLPGVSPSNRQFCSGRCRSLQATG